MKNIYLVPLTISHDPSVGFMSCGYAGNDCSILAGNDCPQGITGKPPPLESICTGIPIDIFNSLKNFGKIQKLQLQETDYEQKLYVQSFLDRINYN